MKKTLLFFVVIMLSVSESFSQATFNTGAIGVDVNQYGKIELFNSAGIYQLWRTSILVGTSSTAVFDYQNDAESLEETTLVIINLDFVYFVDNERLTKHIFS